MSYFVWGSSLSYNDYIQGKSFVSDITSSSNRIAMEVSKQTRQLIASNETLTQMEITSREQAVNRAMAHQTELAQEMAGRITSQLSDGFNEVSHRLSEGFETLSYDLRDISAGIDELKANFHWGFSSIMAELGGMNDSIKELIKIAKTPAQTAALEHFDIARDMYRQRIYVDVIEELDKAINGVPGVSAGYKPEWRVHQLRGIIRLGFADCDVTLINLAEAEDAFLKAAQYARIDYPEDAANAYLSAGWAAYCQGKLPDALRHTEAALTLNSALGEAMFQMAKMLMAQDNADKALPVLKNAIEIDVFYSLKAAADGDFQRHEEVLRKFFTALSEEKYNQLSEQVYSHLNELKVAVPPNDLETEMMQMVGDKTLLGLAGAEQRCQLLVSKITEYNDFLKQTDTLMDFRKSALPKDFNSIQQLIFGDNTLKGLPDAKLRLNQVTENIERCKAGWTIAKILRDIYDQSVKPVLANSGHNLTKLDQLSESLLLIASFKSDDVLRRYKDSIFKACSLIPDNIVTEKKTSYEEKVIDQPKRLFRAEVFHMETKHKIEKQEEPNQTKLRLIERLSKIIIPSMIYVAGGSFIMVDTEGGGNDNKKPTDQVTVSSFFIGKCEVTQKEWQEVMGSNPSTFKGDDLPVENVTWYDCVEYCNKLSRKAGLQPCYSGNNDPITCDWTANGYRLPTEAEWVFAARGGKLSKGYKYSGSDDISSVAWYSGNSGSKTHEVGTKSPNELGIYDMSGNVYEWCWDWYDSYGLDGQLNPTGPTTGSYRLLRGGYWFGSASDCRVSDRNYYAPYSSLSHYGFRLCRATN